MTWKLTHVRSEHLPDAVIAFSQDRRDPRVMHTRAVSGVRRLTDARRLAIGGMLADACGLSAYWNEWSDADRLRWTKPHMYRYGDVQLTIYDLTDDDTGQVRRLADLTVDEDGSTQYTGMSLTYFDRMPLASVGDYAA